MEISLFQTLAGIILFFYIVFLIKTFHSIRFYQKIQEKIELNPPLEGNQEQKKEYKDAIESANDVLDLEKIRFWCGTIICLACTVAAFLICVFGTQNTFQSHAISILSLYSIYIVVHVSSVLAMSKSSNIVKNRAKNYDEEAQAEAQNIIKTYKKNRHMSSVRFWIGTAVCLAAILILFFTELYL